MKKLSWLCHSPTQKSSESQQSAQESTRECFFQTLRQSRPVSTSSPHYLDGTSQTSGRNQSPSPTMTLPTCERSENSIIRVGFALGKERRSEERRVGKECR